MTVEALTATATQQALLVAMEWGDEPIVRRYTDQPDPITIGAAVYEPEPTLECELPRNDGSMRHTPAKITIKRSREPFRTRSLGHAFARVRCNIWEYDLTASIASPRELWLGRLGPMSKNPEGRSGLVRCDVPGLKAPIELAQLGLRGTTTCAWIHGDPRTCGADLAPFTLVGSIAAVQTPAVNGLTLSLPGNPTIVPERYRRGRVVVDGATLSIRQITVGGSVEVDAIVPPYWLGRACVVLPGCDRRYATCSQIWGRQHRFMGLGRSTPSRNPQFQVPG